MAEYTVRLGDLINSGYDVEQKAMQSWLSPTAEWRQQVNDAIIQHYWMNEIGQETADMFSYYLKRALDELMPYYNQRREIDMLDLGLDPLTSFSTITETENSNQHESQNQSKTVDGRVSSRETSDDYINTSNESGNHNNTMTHQSTSSSRTDNTTDDYTKEYSIPTTGGSSGNGPGGFSDDFATGGNVYHDKTDSTVSGEVGGTDTDKGTNGRNVEGTNKGTHKEEANDNGTSETSGSDSGTEKGSSKSVVTGYNTAKFELMAKYRDVIENIIPMIINEKKIRNCFMGVLGGASGVY